MIAVALTHKEKPVEDFANPQDDLRNDYFVNFGGYAVGGIGWSAVQRMR